jgi:hypothetical protein
MVRFIGKCASCKSVSARDYTDTVPGFSGQGMSRRPMNIFVRTTDAGRQVRASQDFECPRCGEYRWDGKRVQGFKTDHVCDARCMEAKGFQCECSCGGANHGSSWIVCEAVAA